RPLPPVPDQPDERGPQAPGRPALRRQAPSRHPRPYADDLPLMDLAIRATVLFLFVYLLTRIIGRRELSSLEPFDLILLIVMGDAIQQGLTQDDYSVTGAFIVVGTFAILQVT